MALSTGLNSYWKFDETSGSASDSAGSYSLSNSGVVTYGSGKIGNSAIFSNSSSQVLTATSLPFGTAGSISFWAFMNSGDDGGYFYDSTNGTRFLFLYDSLGGGVIQLNGVAGPTISSGAIPFNQWNLLTLTWDSSLGTNKEALFINGTLYSNANNNVVAATPANFFVGNRYANTGTQDSMNGRIDEMGTWSRALSSLEVTQIYNLGNGTSYPFAPSVTTQAVSLIGTDSATGNGTVVSDNGFTITERGVVYSITTNPTTSNSKSVVSGTTGSFTAPITGLSAGVTYYVRAYAISSQGTNYGSEVSFNTVFAPIRTIYKDIGATTGSNYAVRFTVGGTTGTLTVQLGSTGTSMVLAAGSGVQTVFGTYSGLYGLIFTASADFNGWIDDVMYVYIVTSGDYTLIDWSLNTFTTLIAIASSVVFRRIEDDQFNKFRIYRYLDLEFKDLDGYITTTIRQEQNDLIATKTTVYLVGGTSGDVSPFVKKKLSFLSKSQALLIGLSNNNLNDSFAITKFYLSGIEQPSKLFDRNKIISIG